jgi:hypothetical protein
LGNFGGSPLWASCALLCFTRPVEGYALLISVKRISRISAVHVPILHGEVNRYTVLVLSTGCISILCLDPFVITVIVVLTASVCAVLERRLASAS